MRPDHPSPHDPPRSLDKMPAMRYVAIDLGLKRTGLAVGDDVLRIASPLRVVEAAGRPLLDAIARTIDEHGPDALVIGLPLNMDGSEGPPAAAARAFGGQLQQHTRLPVHYVDERLTSAAADDQLARTGLTHAQKKARRDALAAAAILQTFLNAA
jgi:putative Holliday junction resolvase